LSNLALSPIIFFLPAGVALFYTLISVLAVFYAERKISAFIQDRIGPVQQGPYGIFQAVADIGKLLQKGHTTITGADKLLFAMAPLAVFGAVFAGFVGIPILPGIGYTATGAGVFYLLAVISLDIAGIWMAGWSSFSKYPLLGAMRSVGQLLSYEVPLGLAILCVVIWAGSVDLGVIGTLQSPQAATPLYLFGSQSLGIDVRPIGGFLAWNIVQVPWFPVLYVIFYLATLAECNRAPFDLPEAEAELVGGFHTEYSGFSFAIFFLAEYALMVLVSVAGIFLFLGGWNTPLPNIGPLQLATWTGATNPIWALIWLTTKTWLLLLSHVWLRWTLPRLRIDQLMHLGWKVLTPAALLMVLATLAWRVF
jgi:NADH-quinone oxidoreductase subunit H